MAWQLQVLSVYKLRRFMTQKLFVGGTECEENNVQLVYPVRGVVERKQDLLNASVEAFLNLATLRVVSRVHY